MYILNCQSNWKNNYSSLYFGIGVLRQYSRFYYLDFLHFSYLKRSFAVLSWQYLNFTLYFYGAYLVIYFNYNISKMLPRKSWKLEARVADMISQLDVILLAYFFLQSNWMNWSWRHDPKMDGREEKQQKEKTDIGCKFIHLFLLCVLYEWCLECMMAIS